MVGFARAERAALSDLLGEVGPDAPTLCEGWTTRDLAAHLVTRDRVPKALPGLAVPALHGVTERAERATREAYPSERLVALVREGVPRWHPARLGRVDENANLIEYVVHHEDVRRAGGDLTPRTLPAGESDALWSRLGMVGRLAFRRLAVGVVAERTDAGGTAADGGGSRLRRGEPVVTLLGTPLELTLFALGRRDASGVALRGDPAAIVALRDARIGL